MKRGYRQQDMSMETIEEEDGVYSRRQDMSIEDSVQKAEYKYGYCIQ